MKYFILAFYSLTNLNPEMPKYAQIVIIYAV